MKKNKPLSKKIFVIGTIIILAIAILMLVTSNIKLQRENNLIKTIMLSDYKIIEASEIEKTANEYYDMAGFYYEEQNYKLVEINCIKARDYYLDTSQEYLTIRSELLNKKIEDKIIDIYSESLEVLSEIQLNMYEACEHFESAVRYYDIYYDTDVPYDDMSYDMGGGEIDSMNEKIRLHDENVRTYNKLLVDIQTKIEERIK